MPKLSIITLSYGSDQYTDSFIEQIDKIPGDFEVIVVDNKGDYKSKGRKTNTKIKILRPGKNLGFAGGNNYGVSHAKSNLFLFINNDVLFHNPNFVDIILSAKTESNVVGHQLISHNTQTEIDGKIQDYLGGWFVLVDRKQYDSIGGWDEDFGLGYYEDVYFSAVAKSLGYELVEVDAGVEHLIGKTFSRNKKQQEISSIAQKVYVSKMLQLGKDKRIVFLYNNENFDFKDEDYEGKGVGGAESALILLSRNLAKRGWNVTIYNGTTVEGVFNGVTWKNLKSFRWSDPCDVFVLYRDVHPELRRVSAKTKIFFSCDQVTSGDWNIDVFPFVDSVICISEFHKEYMSKHYNVDKDIIQVMDLGVKDEDYEETMTKIDNKLIYCSVPGRGLKHLAKAFPLIQKEIPDVSLVITSDYRLWGAGANNESYIEELSKLPGVEFVGLVPRNELVYHQKTAQIMAYPCVYDENFCISAMECIASGTIPVTFNFGAMKTTVGDSGIVLNGNPTKDGNAIKRFSQEIVSLLSNKQSLSESANKAHYRAKDNYFWSKLSVKYEKFFLYLMGKGSGVDMHKCNVCDKSFETAFEMFKHKSKHRSKKPSSKDPRKLYVNIKTTKKVHVSIGKLNYSGDDLIVPKDSSLDIVRILKEGYGQDIIADMKMSS